MHYRKRFIHRLQEKFLVIGLHDYEELQNLHNLSDEYVELSLNALCCIEFLPNIKHIILTPGGINWQDIHWLYNLEIESMHLDFYTYENDSYGIDLSRFANIKLVFARTQYCFRNSAMCKSLQTLIVQEWITQDLNCLRCSSILALKIMAGNLRVLAGIEDMPNLISLSLSRQNRLTDCSALRKNCLESFGIEKCNGVDIAALPILPNTRMLYLSGSKRIPNIQTILSLASNLEWLLLDHTIEDGDLSLLMKLNHAVIFQNSRHYSHKDNQLPKSTKSFHSEFLPYHLQILPET